MREILQNLVRTQGVRGALVASPDGFVAAAETPDDVDDEAVAAAAAVMQSACAASASRLGKGELSRCVLAGESGGAILTEAGGALLVVLLDANANQGLVSVEVKSATAEVAKHTAF